MLKNNLSGILSRSSFLLILTTLFIFFFNVSFHEPWRDELQIWLICIKSNNFFEFFINRSTENHPFLWHIILYLLSKISSDFHIVQFLNALLISLSIIKIYKYFKMEMHLFLFSYFLIFEYAIITRNYAIEIFLLLLALEYINKKTPKALYITLAVLANTNIFGLMFSFLLLCHQFFQKIKIKNSHLAVVILGITLSFIQLIWQTVFEWGHFDNLSQQVVNYNLEWFSSQTSTIYRGFIPLPNFLEFHFWNTNIIDVIDIKYMGDFFAYFRQLKPFLYEKRVEQLEILQYWSYIILSLLILLGAVISLWKDKKVVIIFFAGTVFMWILFAFIWHGQLRHHGQFFLLFLVCYWFLVKSGNQSKFSKYFLTFILLLQIPGGVYAYYMDWKYDFSGSKKITQQINNLKISENYILTGAFDYSITPISYYLNRDFYNLQSNKYESFINWNRPNYIAPDSVFKKAIKLHIYGSKDVVLVINNHAYDSLNIFNINRLIGNKLFSQIGNSLYKIETSKDALVWDENYYLFLISDKPQITSLWIDRFKPNDVSETLKKHDFCANFNIEKLNSGIINIYGWAINYYFQDNIKKQVLLQNETSKFLINTKIVRREDVYNDMVNGSVDCIGNIITNDTIANNYILNSGYNSMLYKKHIPKGKYKISLVLDDGKKIVESIKSDSVEITY